MLDLPHDWSIEDLPYATPADGGVTADPSLLVTQVPPTEPVPPPVIGPFDPQNSANGGSIGYMVGGIGWYRKQFRLPKLAGTHVELRFDGVYQNADCWINGVPLVFGFGDLPAHLADDDRAGAGAAVGCRGHDTDGWPAAVRAAVTFTVPYRPGELTAIASRNGKEIGQKTLRTVGAPVALRLTSDVRDLTTSRDDLAHVLVEVTDRRGQVVPDATFQVTFDIRGAGELAAVGNGNPHNVDSFTQPRRYTWHGQALAILRPAKKPGHLTLTAHTNGLRPATLTLKVNPRTQ